MKNRLFYEREPEEQIGWDDPIEDPDAEDAENPYEDYHTFDFTVTESMEKHVLVFAKDKESAEQYLNDTTDNCFTIPMTDIDKYEKKITAVEDAPGEMPDYTVPLWWYGEDVEDEKCE